MSNIIFLVLGLWFALAVFIPRLRWRWAGTGITCGPIWEFIASVACLSAALRGIYRDSISACTYSLLGWFSLSGLIVTVVGHIIVRRRIKRTGDSKRDFIWSRIPAPGSALHPMRPPPPELERIKSMLPADWAQTSFRFGGMGWVADFEFRSRRFQLISDCGYIDVYEITDGKQRHVFPPEEQRISISPEQVYELLRKTAA